MQTCVLLFSCQFGNTQFLDLLDLLLRLVYIETSDEKPVNGDESLTDDRAGTSLTAATIFEMVLSHSHFLSTILSEDLNEIKGELVQIARI